MSAVNGGQPGDDQFAYAVHCFEMLADANRVRMLWALRERDYDVTTLAAVIQCPPTRVSQHLSKLRMAGLVEGVRDAQRVVYRLKSELIAELLRSALLVDEH